MQFTTVAAFALSAAAAVASPLEARTGWGSCAKDCQYTCTTNGILNILTCVSVLSGNTISIPIGLSLKRDEILAGMEKRTGDETCCTTNGIANVLTCVDLLDGNTVSVPITAVIGWL